MLLEILISRNARFSFLFTNTSRYFRFLVGWYSRAFSCFLRLPRGAPRVSLSLSLEAPREHWRRDSNEIFEIHGRSHNRLRLSQGTCRARHHRKYFLLLPLVDNKSAWVALVMGLIEHSRRSLVGVDIVECWIYKTRLHCIPEKLRMFDYSYGKWMEIIEKVRAVKRTHEVWKYRSPVKFKSNASPNCVTL